MTAHNVIRLPLDVTVFDRLNARQRLANLAEERAEAVQTCKDIIDDPRGYSDAQLREVCGFYMAQPVSAGGGGVHYLRADQLLFAIERRRQVAVNRAKCRAAVARIDETSARIAMRHLRRWPEIVIGGACFVGFWWIVFSGVLA